MDKFEEFLKFEYDNDLFDYTYKGVHFWGLIRAAIYLCYFTDNVDEHPDHALVASNYKLKLLKQMPKHVFNRISAQPKDIFCSSDNIYKIIDNKRINPYLDFLKEIDFSVHYHTNYNPTFSKDIIYPGTNDAIFGITRYLNQFVTYVFYRHMEKSGNFKKIESITRCLNCLREKLNIQFDYRYECIVMKTVQSFLSNKRFYIKLIKNTKCVILENHYTDAHMALISAARELNVPTIELQHGVIGRGHIAYNFHDMSTENKYLPDYIFTFGDYWTNTMRPPKGTTPISVGFPQLDLSKRCLMEVVQSDTQVVFYSSIEQKLCKLAIEFAEIATELGFVVKYKLHPSECKSWKTLYPELRDNEKIEVLDQALNVHEVLASSKFHIGVNSTVLFEAIAFGGVVFIYDIDDRNVMKDLIEMDFAYSFIRKEELLDLIINHIDVDTKSISEQFFKHNAVKNIEAEINKIITHS